MNMYQISNNYGKKKVKKNKTKENKETANPEKSIRLKWSVIEKMTIEELDIYLSKTFKINHNQ